MAADNLEGKEVDLLIKELSTPARKPAPRKTETAGAAEQPVPSIPVARSFGKGPLEPIAPNSTVRKRSALLSAIKLPGLPKLPDIGRFARWPSLGWLPDLPGFPQLGRPSAALTVRMCVGLGVALCMAMPYWPYPKGCSWWLVFYLFAVTVVVIAGIWAARLTWGARLAVAHMVALGIVFWGITLAAEETLPRIGYAKSEAHWMCP